MPRRAQISFEKFDRNYVALPKALHDPLISSWLSGRWATCHDERTLSIVFEQDQDLHDCAAEAGDRLDDPDYFLPCSECFKKPELLCARFAIVTPIRVEASPQCSRQLQFESVRTSLQQS